MSKDTKDIKNAKGDHLDLRIIKINKISPAELNDAT
jgi:hypothetical protein